MELVAAISLAAKFRNKNKIIPALDRVRIHVKDGSATVSSSTLESQIECDVESITAPDMDVMVEPERMLVALGDIDCSLTLEGDHILVRRGRGRYKVPVVPGNMFPPLKVPAKLTATVPNELLGLVESVQWAASRNEVARPWLKSVHFVGDGRRAVVEAADGGVYARAFHPCESSFDFALPPQFLQKLKWIEPEGPMALHEDVLMIPCKGCRVWAKQGYAFPPMPSFDPRGDMRLGFKRQDMLDAIHAIDSFGDSTEIGKYPINAARFDFKGDVLVVSGHRHTEIELDYSFGGEDKPKFMAFRCDQLGQILALVEGEDVEMVWDKGGMARCIRNGDAWVAFVTELRV